MKKVILAAAACSVLSLLPVGGYGQRLGAPAADAKMLPGGAPASGGVGSLYSPSPYDGSANISIPIFQYSVEGSDFGVSFNYNTKGVPVDEVASDAGLHFLINAGASVSRTVRDLPDEISLIDGDTALYLSYPHIFMQPIPGYTPPFDTVSVNKYWGFKGKYATYTESSASAADKRIYRDREADEFTVNLGSGSFSFYLGKDGTFFTHPNRRVKIEPLLNGLPFTSVSDLQVIGATSIVSPPVMTFRITDEQGNKYLFAPGDDETRDVQDCFGKGQFVTAYKFITRWVISQVTLSDGHTIDYTYRSNTAGRLPVSMSYSLREGLGIWDIPGPGSEVLSTLLSRKLESIRYPNNTTVYFDYDNSRKRRDYHYGALRQIRVSSEVNCLRYILQQSFFYADALTPEKTYTQGTTTGSELELKYRLKLNGLLLGSCDSTVIEPLYSFGYESLGLPPRLDCKQDFFGYYNDKAYSPLGNSVEDLVPRGTPYHYIWMGNVDGAPQYQEDHPHGQDRSVDPAKARAGLLNKITNATGGSARFFYGGHQLSNVLTHVPIDGLYFGSNANDGLRVDSIVESEPFHYGDDRITTFQYSGGQRFLNGGYFYYQNLIDSQQAGLGVPVYLHSIIMTNNYITPHHMVNGANHGYSQVTITTRGIFGQQLSRKVVQFSNFKDGSDAAKYFIQGGGKDFFTYPYSDKQYLLDWKMGLPLEITEYDPKDRIVLKTTNRYGYTIDTTSAIGKVENRKTALVPLLGTLEPGIRWTYRNREVTDDYRPYTGKALLQSTTIRKYVSDNNYIYDSTAYAYDYRDNLDYIITRNSKGAFIKTDQVYNYDMPGPGTAFDMSAARLEKLTGTERWLLGSSGNPDRLLDATINSYTFLSGILQPQNLYQLRTSTPLTYSTLTGYSGGGTPAYPHGYMNAAYNGSAIDYFAKISEVTQRDVNGNPLETYMESTGQYKAMIWDLYHNRKLAEAGSCRYEDIAYCSFEEVTPPAATTTRGNLEYSNLGVQPYTVLGERAPTGSMVYRLHSGILPSGLTTAFPLQQDKTYILSFWYTSTGSLTAMPHIDIAGTPHFFSSDEQIASRGSWKQYQVRITPATSGPVTITAGSSTDILIDEVRLFPLGALMESQCGEPLFGPSSTTDGSGRITYYEYDPLGRQSVVRDQEGNILSRTKNVVRGSD